MCWYFYINKYIHILRKDIRLKSFDIEITNKYLTKFWIKKNCALYKKYKLFSLVKRAIEIILKIQENN